MKIGNKKEVSFVNLKYFIAIIFLVNILSINVFGEENNAEDVIK